MKRYSDSIWLFVICAGFIGIVLILLLGFKACTDGEAAIFNSFSYNDAINKDNIIGVIIASVFNLIIIGVIVICIVLKLQSISKRKLVEKKAKITKALESQRNIKQGVINALKVFDDEQHRNNRFVDLITLSSNDNSLKTKYNSFVSEKFNSLKTNIVKKIHEDERKHFPKEYSELSLYRKKIKSEIKEIDTKIKNINQTQSTHEFEKLQGKGYKRPLRIVFSVVICVSMISGIVALALYNSTSFTLWLAKEDCKSNFDITGIINENTEITVDNVIISYKDEDNVYIPSRTKEVKYQFIFYAHSNDLTKYYTTDKNSDEAKTLESLMLEIYREVDCHSYTYDEVILTYNKEFWQEYAVKDLCLWAAGYF